MDDADQVAAMAPFVPLVTSCAVSAIFKVTKYIYIIRFMREEGNRNLDLY